MRVEFEFLTPEPIGKDRTGSTELFYPHEKFIEFAQGVVVNLSGSVSYTHTQSIAASPWTINHNLGFKPSVEILSAGGVEIEGEVVHVSVNQVVINFTSSITGTARLN